MALSVIGAICNSIGVEKKNETLIISGQRVWVVSNALWIYVIYADINQLITYSTFFICAAYPVINDIIRRLKDGSN